MEKPARMRCEGKFVHWQTVGSHAWRTVDLPLTAEGMDVQNAVVVRLVTALER